MVGVRRRRNSRRLYRTRGKMELIVLGDSVYTRGHSMTEGEKDYTKYNNESQSKISEKHFV